MKKQFMLGAGITVLIFIIIINSSSAKEGALSGWLLCENVIVPSLLPILILTNICVKSSACRGFERLFGKAMRYLFKLPECSAVAILFGLVGGYPAGAVLTQQLYKQGSIDSRTAARIMLFNFSGGAAFLMSVVGKVCYNSTKYGVILFVSNILADIIIGIVTGLKYKKAEYKSSTYKPLSLSKAVTTAVEISIKSVLNMCAYIILFACIVGIVKIPSYITPLIEITNGVCLEKNGMPLEYCAFFTAFGGLCIHFQIFDIIKSFGMKYTDFLISRFSASILSFAFIKLYLYAFPQDNQVFSNISAPISQHFAQVNTGLSVLMILGCAVLILDIESRKSKLI